MSIMFYLFSQTINSYSISSLIKVEPINSLGIRYWTDFRKKNCGNEETSSTASCFNLSFYILLHWLQYQILYDIIHGSSNMREFF